MAIDLGEDDALAEAGSATVATKWTTKVAEIISRAFHSETNRFGTAALRDTGSSDGNVPALNANGRIPQNRLRIPVRNFTADEFKDRSIQGIDFVAESMTFREVGNGQIPYTAFDIKGTPTEGARVIYNFEDGTLEWDADFGNIIGEIQIFPYSSAVAGWLPCDGRSLSRTTYFGLFSVLSTTYGNVDDDHFNLPDLRNRVVVGKGTSDAFSAIGKTGGSEAYALTENEMPSHNHLIITFALAAALSSSNGISRGFDPSSPKQNDYYSFYRGSSETKPTIGLSSEAGGGKPHNNVQPYIVKEYRIFTG